MPLGQQEPIILRMCLSRLTLLRLVSTSENVLPCVGPFSGPHRSAGGDPIRPSWRTACGTCSAHGPLRQCGPRGSPPVGNCEDATVLAVPSLHRRVRGGEPLELALFSLGYRWMAQCARAPLASCKAA